MPAEKEQGRRYGRKPPAAAREDLWEGLALYARAGLRPVCYPDAGSFVRNCQAQN